MLMPLCDVLRAISLIFCAFMRLPYVAPSLSCIGGAISHVFLRFQVPRELPYLQILD
jgi:hypothetical protein